MSVNLLSGLSSGRSSLCQPIAKRSAKNVNSAQALRRIGVCLILSAGALLHNNSFADHLPDVKAYPELSDVQLGHIRFIVNLAGQKDNDWSKMDSSEPGQGGFDSYRYQLAMMSYALNLANYYYTPAYREVYQDADEKLIHKMLRPDVWNFWELTSKGAKQFDPDLVKLSEGWKDPVIRQNIMYSGHLFQMVNTYAMLYNNNKFDQPESIKFVYNPVGQGMGKEEFNYDTPKLAKVLHDQFMESGWSGIECEPNAIFPECNQHPILGFKLFDQKHGTSYFNEVSTNYKKAFDEQKFLNPATDSFMAFKFVKQSRVIQAELPWSDGWTGIFMHGWSKDDVERIYPIQKKKYLVQQADGTNVIPFAKPSPFYSWDNGFFAVLAGEVGDSKTSEAILNYADKHWSPTWVDGGLYYPRNDNFSLPSQAPGANGKRDQFVSPRVNVLTGNALLALARMETKDGFYNLFNKPWTEDHFKQPFLTGVEYPKAYVSRAVFDPVIHALVATIRPAAKGDAKASTRFSIENLPNDDALSVFINQTEVATIKGEQISKLKKGISITRSGNRLTITTPFQKPINLIVQSRS